MDVHRQTQLLLVREGRRRAQIREQRRDDEPSLSEKLGSSLFSHSLSKPYIGKRYETERLICTYI